MDEPFFTPPGKGERIRQHRVLAFRLCGVPVRLLNFHTPNAGFIERLRDG